MPMYARTGIRRPSDNVATLAGLAATWGSIARGASQAAADVDQQVHDILDANSGEAAGAFDASMSGPQSAPGGLTELADAAQRTAAAHASALRVVASTLTTMDATCAHAEHEYHRWGQVPILGSYFQAQIVDAARTVLTTIQDDAVTQIEDAFGLTLPEPLVPYDADDQGEFYGTIPDDIEALWEGLSDEQRRQVLQAIADEWAIANGMEPQPIEWDSSGLGHWDPATGTLHIDSSHVEDPSSLHTVVHEMRHGLQMEMMDSYSSLSDADRAAIINGTMPDPYEQYGSNIHEMARLEENWNEYGYNTYDGRGSETSDSWRDYYYQPMERDARRHGMHFLDGLTAADIEDYLR